MSDGTKAVEFESGCLSVSLHSSLRPVFDSMVFPFQVLSVTHKLGEFMMLVLCRSSLGMGGHSI